MTINSAIFEPFPFIETERLLLRDIRKEDAVMIFNMRSSGRVNRFIPRNNMETPEEAAQLIGRTCQAFQNREAIGWSGVIKGKTEIIGTCGFNHIDYTNLRAEIGGELDIASWGKKLALEAVQAIIRFGFEEMHLHSIEAKVSPENKPAIFLLERTGFKKEAHFTDRIYFGGAFSDMAIYTLIRQA